MKAILFCTYFLLLPAFSQHTSFAKGQIKDVKWEAFFNLPDCQHSGTPAGAWCKPGDKKQAIKISGVEAKIKYLANLPKIKSLHLAFFSFSNSNVKNILCDALKRKPSLNLNFYINSSNKDHRNILSLKKCSKNVNIYSRGVGPFGTKGAHLMHMKIILASTQSKLSNLFELTKSQQEEIKEEQIYFSSSSANLSSNGTSLHFENWLFLQTNLENNLAQKNICLLNALEKNEKRQGFSLYYKSCIKSIKSSPNKNLEFYAVPSSKIKKPYTAMKKMIASADKEILVAIHRLTTSKIYNLFLEAADRGIKVKIILDDDMLRAGVRDGGFYQGKDKKSKFNPYYSDIKSYRALREHKNITIKFMETNATPNFLHLFHNKFIVVDGEKLFQGAGNFTGTALNITGKGNYEQFYVFHNKEIAQTYKSAWSELFSRASFRKEHPVGSNKDK